MLVGRNGIPFGWATDGANRHDVILFELTLVAGARRGMIVDIDTMHLDRGYYSRRVRDAVARFGIDDSICAKKQPAGTADVKLLVTLGMRWPIERTNSWLSNFGQVRRNTDRCVEHQLAQFVLR